MLRRFLIAVFCGCVLAFSPDHARAFDAVEAFGSLPAIDHVRLSPKGKYLAVIRPIGGHNGVYVYPLAGGKPATLSIPDAVVREALWHDDEHLIIVYTTHLGEGHDQLHTWSRAISFSPNGGKAVALAPGVLGNTVYGGIIADPAPNDPGYIYLPAFLKKLRREDASAVTGYDVKEMFSYNLFRVSVATGQAELAAAGTSYTQQWVTDGQGHVVARLDEGRDKDVLFSYTSGEAREIASFPTEKGRQNIVAGLTQDGQDLAIFGPDGPTAGLYALDLATGQKTATLFADPKYDVNDPQVNEWTGRVVGASYISDRPHFVYFDPERAAIQKKLEDRFPGLTVTIQSVTADEKLFAIEVSGPQHAPTVHLYDREKDEMTRLGSFYPMLDDATLGERRTISYIARDGLAIEGYLTLPPGKSAEKLPMVVLPHGGPEARDPMPFDWWAAYLAYRGYAVFQPNFRGSAGYGTAFALAGAREWGAKMQDDVTDGVNTLIAQGIADPKRICIVGGSYGGYAALAGAVSTPDLYACAVGVAPVTDLGAFLASESERYNDDRTAMAYWETRIGKRYSDSAFTASRSPVNHAAQIKVPVLLIHGAHDTTVPFAQSQEMYDALKAAGKDAKLVTLEGDDHYLSQADTRKKMLGEMDAFLKAHIGD